MIHKEGLGDGMEIPYDDKISYGNKRRISLNPKIDLLERYLNSLAMVSHRKIESFGIVLTCPTQITDTVNTSYSYWNDRGE
jgi:hypothetical protein